MSTMLTVGLSKIEAFHAGGIPLELILEKLGVVVQIPVIKCQP